MKKKLSGEEFKKLEKVDDEEINSIIDWGLASENEYKIIKFLDKINSINVEHSKLWEQEIFSFFSEELIVPYLISTSIKEEDKKFMGMIKDVFFSRIFGNHVLFWDSNNCYKDLIKMRESLKTGVNIKEYLGFLFETNSIIKRMMVKRTDEGDSRFYNFGASIYPVCYKLKKENKIIGYETIYFILPDKDVEYPLKQWHKKISKEWKTKLYNKLNNKIKKNNKRKPIDSKLRHECFKRDEYKCVECGATNKETTLHSDHILPVSQKGTDELSNLQTLCENCNLAKSNKHWKGKNGSNNN